jgi:citrate lyase subunit beta/citryl-CoA lyase
MMQTSDVFGADAVIFDLEDSIHVSEKESARTLVRDYLTNHPALPKTIILRVNAADTDFYQRDLSLLSTNAVDAIMLPKATEKTTRKLSEELKLLRRQVNLTRTVVIYPIIELARSFLDSERIAACPDVAGILLGGEDFCSDMEIKRTTLGAELTYPRAHLAIVCRAHGIEAIDTPFSDVNDDAGLRRDAMTASSLGMTAKAAIHPRQIAVIQAVFSPSADQIAWAKKVILGAEDAASEGLGVFSLDGKMVDQPIIHRANTILEKAKRFGLDVPYGKE